MKIFTTLALVVLLPTASTAGGYYCEAKRAPPPEYMKEPTVPYMVFEEERADLQRSCASDSATIGGCVIPNQNGGPWTILTLVGLSDEELECVMRHEKAHMPPNNWDHGPSVNTWVRPEPAQAIP